MEGLTERMGKLSPAKRRLLVERLAKKLAADDPEAVIPRSYDRESLPLSYGQERFWFLQQLHPDNASYNLPSAVCLTGELDLRALQLALTEIFRRHEILRAVFKSTEKGPVQLIRPELAVEIPQISLEALAPGEKERVFRALASEAAGRPFDLSQGPLLRLLLIRPDVDRHMLVRIVHHIVSDGWSDDVFYRELVAFYEAFSLGRQASLPEPILQYGDYVLWQRERVEGGAYKEQLAYWRERLSGAISDINFPIDRPRSAARTFDANLHKSQVPRALVGKINALCRQHDVTKFMLFLAVFAALLRRWSGEGDLAVAVPVANRRRSELEDLIGFFLNTLVLRVKLQGKTAFRALLEEVEKATLEAQANQDVPFEQVVEALHPERVEGIGPLSQIFFAFREIRATAMKLPGVEVSTLDVGVSAVEADLVLFIEEQGEELALAMVSRADLLDRTTMQRFLRHFESILESALLCPDARVEELRLFEPRERHQLLVEWNDTERPLPAAATIHALVEAQAAATPEAVALGSGRQQLSYRELDRRANRLAHHLRALGVGPEVVVGISMERSSEMVVALMGVLKAGGVYLPLDPSYPAERRRFMLADSGARVVVGDPQAELDLSGVEIVRLGKFAAPAPPAVSVLPAHRAYAIYTSGSTGRPKGVEVSHRALVNFLEAMRRQPGLGGGDVLAAVTSLSFDIAALELFLPLVVGARVEVVDGVTAADGTALRELLERTGATVLQGTPATWLLLLGAGWESRRLRALCGGEALPPELARELVPRTAALWNLYGPTETTVWSAVAQLPTAVPIHIGRPIGNTEIHVLDRGLRPVPIAVVGELYIGGTGLARGYLGRPARTAETFLPNPLGAPGSRLYRTGDLARVHPDGRLDCLGRIDTQVKLRGFRIELGEIETRLSSHPELAAAVVVVRDERLVAYAVPAAEKPAVERLRAFLGEQLPAHMVPSVFVFLSELPLTPNRKVDRQALPAPDVSRPRLETTYAAPASDLEKAIAEIWQEVLGVERVGLDDNFFDVGGHSLLLAQVGARLSQLTGGEVPMMELFRHPNVRSLAAFLSGDEREAERAAPAVVLRARPGTEIAIIGMSARFPGADSVEEFWQNLCGGVESFRRLSDEELAAAGVDPEVYRAPDYVPVSATLRDPDHFDAAFFGFNPREAEILDPQHRVFLECAWQALESAGYDPTRYPGAIGVFAGSGMSRYAMNLFSNPELVQSLGMAPLVYSVGQDFLAPRISYKLNLTGPSIVVQTACSTSLVAVHLARQALAEGNCDMALAGGVTLLDHPPQGYRYLEGGIQSPDGHCRAFDAAAQGMVSSSGAAVLVLKRLADALADGDPIHAVVKATAVNNDGAMRVGFTAPSEQGQARVIRAALELAGVEPETIGYLEAHGTATVLGDPIEVAALSRVFGKSAARRGTCALGSVKTNIGHADTAAAAAGLIKAALAVKHALVPPSLHFERPNPAIDFTATPFYVPTELREWDGDAQRGRPRRAGVSSFGIGGTNAHAVVEQTPAIEPSGRSRPWQLLVLSAATATALEAVTARLADDLKAEPRKNLADVAFTCQVGRRRLPHRRTLVVRGHEQARAALAAPADWTYVAEAVEERNQRSVVFLCSGLGEQYPGMGRGLYDQEPVFRAEVDRCCALLEPLLGLDLRSVLYPEQEPEPDEASGPDLRRLLRRRAEPESEAHRRLSETRLLQPAVFVIEVALARLLRSWGIVPRAMIGYSLGEYTAAYLAGVLELGEALRLVAQRAELIATLPAGAMTAVALSEAEILPYLGAEIELAASNAPEVSVVAGPEEALARCEEQLASAGCVYQRLQTRHAFHSSMMKPIAAALGERVRQLTLRPPEIPYLSNVTGTWITAGEATDPEYWGRQLCRPVRFTEGLSELLRDPEPVLLEMGPGQALATAARQHPERPAGKVVVATLRDEREQHGDQTFLLRTLGQLWGAGAEIDWSGFYAEERRHRVTLPTYPFERRRFWIESGRQPFPAPSRPALRKQEELADWFYVPSWQPSALAGAETEDDRRWLLLVDECGLGAEMARQLAAVGRLAVTVRPGEGFARLGPASYTVRPAERSDYEALLAELRREGGIPQHWVHLWSVTGPASPGAPGRPEKVTELGFYSLISQMQALGGERYAEPLRLAVVSDGVASTGRGEALWPEKAAVLGPCKVIPLEYPNVRCSSIDVALDDSGDPAEPAGQLIAELRAGLADPIVAYREGTRLVQSYEPLPLAAVGEKPELPHRGVYLILGGMGGIGGVLARYLAETFEARLVLTDRSPFPAREQWEPWLAGHAEDDGTSVRIRELRTLEELGAEVVVEQADVADEPAMRGVVERTRARFGALDAVIHAAGVAGGGVIQLKRREVAAEVLRSKLAGMRVLEAVLADSPPQWLLLFSSINAVVGVFAQVDYCAANCVLDAFAWQWQRQRPEIRCVAVDWGQWKEVGMGVEAERDSELGRAMLESLGISPAEGLEALERILCRHRGAEIVVSAVDLGELLAVQQRAREDRYGFEEALPAVAAPRERHARPDVPTPYAAPRNPIEARIVEIWQELLGIEHVGIRDEFIALGGHSLLGIQLYSRLQQAFGVTVPLPVLFETQTIAAMAAIIAGGEELEPAEAPVVPVPRERPLPLSFGQERLWFLSQLEPESAAYNLPQAFRLRGALEISALERSLDEIVRRHETLRTTFAQGDEGPVQAVAPPAPLRLTTVDLTAAGGEDEAVRLLWREGARPFDLAREWTIRACLMRLAPDTSDRPEHLLLITAHHIAFDTWSQILLHRELAEGYTAFASGREPRLPALEVQYADFAVWQRERLRDEVLERQIAYWTERLGAQPPAPELPTDRPRPPVETFAGDRLQVRIEPALRTRLEALSRERGTTLFMTMLAIFQTLLLRTTGQNDLTTGTPVGGRIRPEVKDLIGMFINNLVLRTDLGGDPPFRELLERVREVALEAFAHQELPFEKLVEVLRPQRDLSRAPLFQVLFVLQTLPAPTDIVAPAGVELTPLAIDSGSAIYDLTLNLEQDLSGWLEYNTDLFDATTVARLWKHFRCLAQGAVEAPATRLSALPLVAAPERHQLLAEWNDTGCRFPGERAIHELIAARAERRPEAVAVVCEGRVLSYGELGRRSALLAGWLAGHGVGAESLVGIALEPDPELVVALLGVLRAGAAYLPLDPSYPRERLASMVGDSGTAVLITREHLRPLLPEFEGTVLCLDEGWMGESKGKPVGGVAGGEASGRLALATPISESLAYVIYTSGSTGKPKGVGISHRALVNFLGSMRARPGLEAGDRLLSVTPLSFDISGLELFLPLLAGATVELVSRATAADGAELRKRLARATVLQATPATWYLLLAEGWTGGEGLKALCGGEALSPQLAAALVDRTASAWNMYGPTETTIWSAVHAVVPADAGAGSAVSIGRPIANTELHVVGPGLRPQPMGVAGELLIGGAGLARGYHGRPALAAERFIPNPFASEPGARLYRTGDLTRRQSDGRMDFLGRLDHQVKLRGFRIELGEIESVLAGHPSVAVAVVILRGAAEAARLVAYLVPAGAAEPAPEALRRHLRESLPEYMVPAAFVVLEELPLLPNGKVNRRALPEPEAARPAPEAAYAAPASELEQTLAAIWQEVLGLERVGLYDNFFDVGGHSLLLAQVRMRLRAELERDVPLVDLFRYPSIRTLADYLSGTPSGRPRAVAPAVAPVRPGEELAVVGISCRFPGAEDIDEFWRNLCGGVESIRMLSDEELIAAGVDRMVRSAPEYIRASAEIKDPDHFDAALFGFSPREAEALDPQHRIFLECAWQALEAAGYDPTRYPGRIGVFAGAGMGRYAIHVFGNPELMQTMGGLALTFAVGQDYLATRISYKLNLTGPSVVVQSACSTGLVAVHLARHALFAGECDMALAGAVALSNFKPQGYLYAEGGILSPDGHCRAFDARAGGTIFGSGVGAVVLKRLADARADGDVIHAVIKASAINNDGALKVGYTAPSEEGQAQVIRTALHAAQVDPATITYVETHGTATPVGDPIEVAALSRVFRESTDRRGFCALGSVKTNIGHTDTVAGTAGLIKTALALKHGLLPPSLHFETPNPEIDFAASPFRVVTELEPWESTREIPRRAGVSSFGIGGTNVHLVLEEPPPAEPSGPSRRWQLLILSAATPTARTAMSERLAGHLRAVPETDLADVAYTCQVGRRRLPHRRFLVCRAAAEAAELLARGAESERVHDASEERGERSVVFLLSGLGDHYAGMGRELYDHEPAFRAEVDRCCEFLEPILGVDLRTVLYPAEQEPQRDDGSGVDLRALVGRGAQPVAPQPLAETRLAQPAVFVVQVALARLLGEWGVVPAALIGYSLGEYTAAHLAGVLSLDDALSLVAARAQLIATVPAGGMLAVPLPAAELESLLGEELALAATNGPEVSVVAGPEAAIDRLAEELTAGGQLFQRLRTRHAFHSPMLRPIAAQFGARVREVVLRPPRIRYLSNVTGTWIRAEEATDPDYWVRHLCQTVRFAEGMEELMADAEPVLLEVGPGQALATSARQHPARPAGKLVVATLRDERERQSDQAFLLHTLGRLWLAGVEIDWSGFYAGERRRRVVLPGYPFERRRFFVEPGETMAVGRLGARNPDLGDWFYLPSWKRSLPPAPVTTDAAAGRWLLIADDEGLAERVAGMLSARGGEVTLVRAGSEPERRGEREWEIDPERPEHYELLLETLVADGGAPERVVHFRSFTPAGDEACQRFAAAQARGLYSLLPLTQALVKVVFADRVTLTVVTSGLQDVERGDEPAPEKATLLGALRVIPQEYAHLPCRNIDVAPAAGAAQEELAAVLSAELTAAAPEPVVAYRGGSRWVESFEPVHLEAPPEGVGLRRQGVYLITGGLGRIGLHLAEYLARTVEARLVLVARSPLPPRSAWDQTLASSDTPPEVHERITRLLALEAAGAELLVVAADVADRAEMQAAVDQAHERFGAVDGVFHLAGVFRAGAFFPVDVTDPELCRRQFRPKVDGVEVLAEVLEPLAPEFCVLFSSLSVVLGGLGFTAYAAANAFMDAFARTRPRRGGVPWISVDWDAWELDEDGARGPGFGRTLAQFEMQADEAFDALRRVLGLRGVPQIVVSTGDLDARIATWVRTPGDQAETPGLITRQRPELSQAYVAPTNETEAGITEIWETLLGIEQVGIHDNFLELGGDSLIGVQLIARLRERFRVQLSVPEVFEASTVAGIAALIAGRDEQEDLSQLDLLLNEVEEMSEDDVEDQLRAAGEPGL